MARKKPSKVSDQYALVKKFPDGWYYRLGSGSSSPWLGPFQTQHVAERVREHATGGPWGTPGVEKPARSHAAKKTASSAPSTFTIVRLRGNQVSFWTGSRWTNEFPDAGEADSLPLAYAAFASAQDRSFTEGDEISIVENYGLDSERTVRHIVKDSRSHATKKSSARRGKRSHAAKAPAAYHSSISDSDKIRVAIERFPSTFGLRGFPGDVFRISPTSSYVSGGRVMLYTERKDNGRWLDFSKGTESELRSEVTPLPSTGSAHSTKKPVPTSSESGIHPHAKGQKIMYEVSAGGAAKELHSAKAKAIARAKALADRSGRSAAVFRVVLLPSGVVSYHRPGASTSAIWHSD